MRAPPSPISISFVLVSSRVGRRVDVDRAVGPIDRDHVAIVTEQGARAMIATLGEEVGIASAAEDGRDAERIGIARRDDRARSTGCAIRRDEHRRMLDRETRLIARERRDRFVAGSHCPFHTAAQRGRHAFFPVGRIDDRNVEPGDRRRDSPSFGTDDHARGVTGGACALGDPTDERHTIDREELLGATEPARCTRREDERRDGHRSRRTAVG